MLKFQDKLKNARIIEILSFSQNYPEKTICIEVEGSKRVYEIPVEMELLKDIVDANIQVDLLQAKRMVFEVPQNLPTISTNKKDTILSDKISFENEKVY